jgi:hypothetical protein
MQNMKKGIETLKGELPIKMGYKEIKRDLFR